MASEEHSATQQPRSSSASSNTRKSQHHGRNRYQSPPPPPTSITPPPTSQAPNLTSFPAVTRTPTPTQSHLSSPPPTVKAGNLTLYAAADLDSATPPYSEDQIGAADADELRNMLKETTSALIETARALRESRASAAHHKLQYSLLCMESSEALKRMEVELEMTQKEVEVMQNSATFKSPGNFPTRETTEQIAAAHPPSKSLVIDLRHQAQLLETENQSLRRRLDDAKLAILEREAVLSEHNEQLRERIREKRKHLNLLCRSVGMPEGSLLSSFTTPQNPGHLLDTQATPFNANSKTRENEPFAALLLADQVLSQEAASTPSTPTSRAAKRHFTGHTRGAHSLSSLPTTPQRPPPLKIKNYGPYLPQDTTTARSVATPKTAPVNSKYSRRRESRDSTISASEPEDQAYMSPTASKSSRNQTSSRKANVLLESPASQEAANILRRSSFRQSSSANSSQTQIPSAAASAAATRSSEMLQTKLYGYPIKKAGLDKERRGNKRKLSAETGQAGKEKKGKVDEGVGLGIGGWTGR